MTADCLPILLCDTVGTCVAVVHAGWRGLAAGVIERTVAAMPVPPHKLLAWLGPAIGVDAFEVGDEVRAQFVQHDEMAAMAFHANVNGRWQCNLTLLARQRLVGLGVSGVFGGGFCTYTDASRFFSYRRDGATGRMAAMIWLE
jgi:YfiH family protein